MLDAMPLKMSIDIHRFMRPNLPVHITAATRTQTANNRDSLYPNASLDPPWKSPDEVGEESKIANKSGRATSSAKERPQQIKAIIWLDITMYESPHIIELGRSDDSPI